MSETLNSIAPKDTLIPMMTQEEILLLKSILENSKEYFEWGVGGSTTLAHNCGVGLIQGIDSSKEWIQKVTSSIDDQSRLNIVYINIGPVKRFGYPKSNLYKLFWPRYSKAIWNVAKSPDLILIDGRFRVACAIQTVLFCVKNKLNPKILLHDINRDEYEVIYRLMNPLDKIPSISKIEKGLQVFEIKKDNNIQELKRLYKVYKYNTI